MNYEEVLQQMVAAATGAAKGQWNSFRGFAEIELKKLSEAGRQLEEDYVRDSAAALRQADAKKRSKLEAKAKLRAQLGFENLTLAGQGVIDAAQADAKIAAQDAINAALGVLRAAINKSIGVALL